MQQNDSRRLGFVILRQCLAAPALAAMQATFRFSSLLLSPSSCHTSCRLSLLFTPLFSVAAMQAAFIPRRFWEVYDENTTGSLVLRVASYLSYRYYRYVYVYQYVYQYPGMCIGTSMFIGMCIGMCMCICISIID